MLVVTLIRGLTFHPFVLSFWMSGLYLLIVPLVVVERIMLGQYKFNELDNAWWNEFCLWVAIVWAPNMNSICDHR